MRRRDVPKALLASAAGSALVVQQADAQTCTPPCYLRTPAETIANVVPTNTTYPPGDVRRYGAVGDGAADDTNALSTLLDVMLANGGDVALLPPGKYRVATSITKTLTPNPGPSSAGKGLTLSAYGATILFEGSGYALDLYSPNTSATFYLPQLNIAGLNIQCTSGASGGIRINDLSSARFNDVFVQGATAGTAFTLRNTATWCENTRLVSCGAVNCFNGLTFERTTGGDSFARTYVNHFFAAGISNYWFLINENCSVYDSQFEHVSGNFGALAYFAVGGDMTGSIIYGIHAEVNSTKPGQGAIRILNYPQLNTVRRRPILVNLGPLAVFTSTGTIPIWTDGNGAAIPGPEAVQRQTLGTDTVLVTPAPTVIAGQIALGNQVAPTATAGANGAPPAQVAGYMIVNIGGTNFKVPYYAA